MILRPPYLNITPSKLTYLIVSLLLSAVLWTIYYLIAWDQRDESYVEQFLLFTTIICSSYFVIHLIRSSIVSTYRQRGKFSHEYSDNFTVGTQAVATITTVVAIVTTFFIVFNIPFGEFITSIALFGVALAIVFKEYIQNFVHALYLLFSSHYHLGRWLYNSHGVMGQIRWFNFQNMVLVTPHGSQHRISYVKLLEQSYVVASKDLMWINTVQVPHKLVNNILKDKATLTTELREAQYSFSDISVRVKSYEEFSAILTVCIYSVHRVHVRDYATISDIVNVFIAQHVTE